MTGRSEVGHGLQHGSGTSRVWMVGLVGGKDMSRRLRTIDNTFDAQAPRKRGGNMVGHGSGLRADGRDHGKHEGTGSGEGNLDAATTSQSATRGLLTSVEKMREEKRQEVQSDIGLGGLTSVKMGVSRGGVRGVFRMKGVGSVSVVGDCRGHRGRMMCRD